MNKPAPRLLAAFAAVLLALTVAALAPRPQVVEATFSLEQSVPLRFAGWHQDPSLIPIAPTPDVQAELDKLYEQLVNRTYVNQAGQRIMLTIAWGGDQRDALRSHRQDVCYRAQGFTVQGLEKSRLSLTGREVEVTRFHGTKGARSEPVTYWMTMGDRVTGNRFDSFFAQVWYSIRTGSVPDGMVVRVSSFDNNATTGYLAQRAFLDDLLASAPPHVANRLMGGAQ